MRGYHRAGGIVTPRRRRPSSFPFSLPNTRTNTRRSSASTARVPFQSTHARTYTNINAVYALVAVWLGSLTRQSRTDRPTSRSVVVVSIIFYRNKNNLNIIIIVVVYYYYHHRYYF